ncbi:ATP-dependent zinc metalloprotease FtsH 4 [Mariprofundus micogutta]|uniref:ATP-dependent zinc metalloprotease FtsH 4 n=1 Tax=Mariprofundus micogutta TaxID=1921010 RepID=A0A1L8CRD1_9PROT|nr:ATP-binding protein [Mariprofundus micogutta]GAV21457.1 ATP-dependent zinc metalloprotease FtsH 4 [Mariprofundus micogutta]
MIKKSGEIDSIESDFANLARLAASGASEDIRLFLARLVRKYRRIHPDLAVQLDQYLKASQARGASSSVLRRGGTPEVDSPRQFPLDKDSQLSLIRVFNDYDDVASPLLPSNLLRQIEMVIREHVEREHLADRGISPTRSAILVGPPGVGKTLTARWIAKSLGKPLWVLDLAAVMSSFLGKTGNNLKAALDHAKSHDVVLLLDEIDAIAKRRSDESDIGELKRLVTVILQEVDLWPDTGLLLAATNHPELVDPALWRRFDAVLKFDVPDDVAVDTAVRRFLRDDLSVFEPWVNVLVIVLSGQSLSDVERAIASLRRGYALQYAPIEELVEIAINQVKVDLTQPERLQLAVELAKSGKHSHMKISQVTGVARDTIRKHAGPSPRKGRGVK